MHNPTPRRQSLAGRALQALRFGLERLVVRGVRTRLLLASAIVGGVALAGGGLVALLDPETSGLSDAIWWAFLRLTDPGYLGDDQGLVRRSVSTVVTVLGYVLFLGLLIAILTQWLNALIQKLEAGVTPVALRGHVIVLGWTHHTPIIVGELLRTRTRVERFLEDLGARELRIVILAEQVDAALARELRERLGDLFDDRKVLLRSGTPLRLDHLERVAFLDAGVLILPGAEHGEEQPQAVDAETVKTLMAISAHARQAGATPPLAVAKLVDGRRASVARRAYAGECEILAVDELIARLVAQSLRQRGLGAVFTELLTLNVGNAIFLSEPGELVGKRFGELPGHYSRAVPIGAVRGDRTRLVPDPSTRVEADDLLVCVARRFGDCLPDVTPPSPLPCRAGVALRPALERGHRLLVLGWSRKVPALLREFERYGRDLFEVDIVSSTPVPERERHLAHHACDASGLSVRQIEAGCSVPGVLERLEPQRYDQILILASEQLSDEGQADATTALSYQVLCELLPDGEARPQILVELLNTENRFLFEGGREGERQEVLVSPQLTSYMLSQVGLRRRLAGVFLELSRPWGAQIVLQSAKDLLEADGDDGPVRFADLQRLAAERGEIALGVSCPRGADDGLLLNPDREAELQLGPDDQVIVLACYADLDAEA